MILDDNYEVREKGNYRAGDWDSDFGYGDTKSFSLKKIFVKRK